MIHHPHCRCATIICYGLLLFCMQPVHSMPNRACFGCKQRALTWVGILWMCFFLMGCFLQAG